MYILTARYANGVCEELSPLAACLPGEPGLASDMPYRLIGDSCLFEESSSYSEEPASQIYPIWLWVKMQNLSLLKRNNNNNKKHILKVGGKKSEFFPTVDADI